MLNMLKLIHVVFAVVMETGLAACLNPSYIGEIRNWKDNSQCLDVVGGRKNVRTHLCDGGGDQMWRVCEDGTIRNHNNNCLDVRGHNGWGNVQEWECEVYPRISRDQQWDLIADGIRYDRGIAQQLFLIKNRKSGKCLDIGGYDGSGNVLIWHCDGAYDQKFYFRNRGGVVAHGKLINKKSGHCLDVTGTDGTGNIGTYKCDNGGDQVFALYRNGELVNSKSKHCVDVAGYDGTGNIATYPCEAELDQTWKKVLKTGDWFSFANRDSNHCIDVSGSDGTGRVQTWPCDDRPDQKWKFVKSTWTTPVGYWSQVQCNPNGYVKYEITTSKTSTRTISREVTAQIGLEMEGGVLFASTKVSASVSASLANSWTKSKSESQSVTVECEYNDDRTEFTGGCMWQWHMSTENPSVNQVGWQSGFTKCTPNHRKPNCPPFMSRAKNRGKGCIPNY